MTHVFDEGIAHEYARLGQECEPDYDIRLLYNHRGYYSDLSEVVKQPGAVAFAPSEIANVLGSHCGRRLLSCFDLVVIFFYLGHPWYDFYWALEYDVRFSGSWRVLFDFFAENDADLLTTTLQRYRDCPDFCWFKGLKPPKGVALPDHEKIRGYLPCYRLSNRGVEILRRAYRRGWRGHFECTVPTILNKYGCRIEDIGGNGEFVSVGNANRFYTNSPNRKRGNGVLWPGSFVCRPVRRKLGRRKNTLWHPVKSEWVPPTDPEKIRMSPVGGAGRGRRALPNGQIGSNERENRA